VFAVAVEPERRRQHRSGIEAAATDAPGAFLAHQSCADQDLDVARHRLQRDIEWRCEFGHQQCAFIQPPQDRAPGRIRESEEYSVKQRLIGVFRRFGRASRRKCHV
jgi:hypothetical protein